MVSSRRFTPDLIALTAALLVLIGAIGLSLYLQIDPLTHAAGSVWNNGRFGTNQLYSWLNSLGYSAQPSVTDQLQPTSEDRILFVLAPDLAFSQWEQEQLDTWVRSGGILILAMDNGRPRDLLRSYNVSSRWRWPMIQNVDLKLPTLNWPFVGSVNLRATRRIEADCGQVAIHIGDCDSPLLVSFGRGRGQVYVMSSLYPFTNEGLENGRNAQFVRNLVESSAAPGSRILFDEVHHQGASFWLVQTPGGWAAILLFLLLLAYALQSNQRFGNPRPTILKEKPERRDTVAFINNMAAAQKELDPKMRVRDHYWQRLKRKLARRYSADPRLPDDLFISELSPYLEQQIMSQLVLSHGRIRPSGSNRSASAAMDKFNHYALGYAREKLRFNTKARRNESSRQRKAKSLFLRIFVSL